MGWARHQIRLLLCAVQFLTRVPTPNLSTFEPDWITRSARYFPLVGQGVGLVSALVLIGAERVWGGAVAAVLAIAVGLLITGAFHEDGLADTADGLGGGQTPARRLEIMKDSRVGTYGVCALGLILATKGAVLTSTPVLTAAVALLAAHGLGRAAAVVAMRATPYAPQGEAGKWKPVPQGVRPGEVLAALLFAAWPLAFLPPGAALAGVAGGALLAILMAALAKRLIGGHTGDVLGAIEQVFELGFLLGVAALA
ncbi:adenosylcobinamide-GDP ribazoletransferase [Caulobacter segnis]|uniref:adenosylcobinamide-GDP ribazoletransferase n=1 Tax=Caulobacter segnis TaxID=88688 RepID=UPI001CBE521E|nr:adenosylcobinamide-GDP ribazoletransferase [Caulobacter segnis]UAL12798.1 adenosylcobinamide-GDP ribazoletransferase [Caulobacter segnis]